ncbi:MAG: stage III sporulation protein AD [Ruminococcaceae bacterium]|nr:stage III sporulation protein AD [Oscillospiraceae bacterium]
MTELLVGIMGTLLCTALLAVVLRGHRPDLALCLSLGAGAVVLLAVLRQLLPLMGDLNRLLQGTAITASHIATVFKAAGICLVTQLTADTCRDVGETALAGKAELAGRLMLLVLSVPVFTDILALVTGLLGGNG